MNRRDWMKLAIAAAGAGSLPRWAWSASRLPDYPFGLGVASGSPGADSVVLWTRLVDGRLQPLAIDQALTVRWEIAEDEAFARIVQRGTANALPQLAHSVHVEVRGLRPDRWYFYRFMTDGYATPPARTRSLPAPDVLPQRLVFGLASCQRWDHGYYAAWRHLSAEAPDLVTFVGDYIYEYAATSKSVRHHDLPLAQTLDDYRARYALHKSDEDLQGAHAACPWILTWDDHEVCNDYAGLQDEHLSPDFPARRAAAYQAYYEHMPLPSSMLRAGVDHPDALRLYARYDFGRLARFHVVDDRQYRDPQVCPKRGRGGSNVVDSERCTVIDDPHRTLLGAEQEVWLDAGFAADVRDGQRWSVLTQQTAFTPRDFGKGEHERVSTDAWDGYPAARQRVIDSIARHAPRNPVIIGGDIHMNWVADVHRDPRALDTPIVAAEFTGTSISSSSGSSPERVQQVLARNPHGRFAAADKRGYALMEVTAQRWLTHLRVVDDVSRRDAAVATQASFVVEDGRRGIRPA